jgi:Tol biopolymer transport system component
MRHLIPILALIVLAVGCGEDRGDVLVLVRDDGIMSYDVDEATMTPLIPHDDPISSFRDVAVSPDGKKIAYVMVPPGSSRDGLIDLSSHLWVANRDGSGARMVYEARERNETLFYPQWRDDVTVLVVRRIAPNPNLLTGVRYVLGSVDVNSGDITDVMDGVLAFGLSRDGERLVAAQITVGETSVDESLRVRDVDGGEATTLVPGDQPLAFFGFPRFSPDGERVAFIALNRAVVFAPKEEDEHAPAGLWLIDVGGGEPSLVTEFDAREGEPPYIEWKSNDEIYVLGEAGFFVVDIDESFAEKLADLTSRSQADLDR